MLLFAGFHPALAEEGAAFNQWVDTSAVNSATGSLLFWFIPGYHPRKSRMLHAPTEGVDFYEKLNPFRKLITSVVNKHKPSQAHGDIKNVLNLARRNSLIANAIFTEALKTGNHFLIWASFHVLMDSFAHEGFQYIKLHGDRGHYPDRPFMFIEKHNEMRKLVFEALTRVRAVIPVGGLTDFKMNSLGRANRHLDGKDLFEAYMSVEEVKKASEVNPHLDPLYKAEAASMILSDLIKDKIISENVKNYIFDERSDLFFGVNEKGEGRHGMEVISEIVKTFYTGMPEILKGEINLNALEVKYGDAPAGDLVVRGTNGKNFTISRERYKALLTSSGEAVNDIHETIVYKLTRRTIPVPALGDKDNGPGPKDTFENDTLYQLEREIQKAKQNAVTEKFGFTPVRLNEEKITSTVWAHLTKWVGGDGGQIERDLAKLEELIKARQMLVDVRTRDRALFMLTMFKYTTLDYATFKISSALIALKLIKKPFGNPRIVNADVLDARLWQNAELFEELRRSGVFRNVYDNATVERMKLAWEKRNEEFSKRLQEIVNRKDGSPLTPLEVIEQQRAGVANGAMSCRQVFKN